MSRNIKRLTLAFLLSSFCFGATVFWYKAGEKKNSNTNKEPVALLKDLSSDVQRKPKTRVIWEDLSKNDSLYGGEAIRTTSVAEAKILFLKTGTLIRLEPESLIVLEETDNGISLDFLKGNLFVKNTGQQKGQDPKAQLKLKSGNNVINLKKASLSLSQGKNGVNLDVFEGQAELLSKDGKKTNITNSSSGLLTKNGVKKSEQKITIISPLPGESVYIQRKGKSQTHFRWKKLPPGYQVFLETGTKRTLLSQSQQKGSLGESGQLQSKVTPGKIYWRLVARSNDSKLPERLSPIFPLHIVMDQEPSLINPTPNESITMQEGVAPISFEWIHQKGADNIAFELATDKSFKNIVKTEYLQATKEQFKLNVKKQGPYFWRVTAFYERNKKKIPLASSPQQFNIQKELVLLPPELLTPKNKTSLSYSSVEDVGLEFSWSDRQEASQYRFNLYKKNQLQKPFLIKYSKTNRLHLPEISSGEFMWTVESLIGEKKFSKPSKPFTFALFETQTIPWAKNTPQHEYLYFTKTPQIELLWEKNINEVTQWKYRYYKVDSRDVAQSKWTDTPQNKMNVSPKEDGLYAFEVHGFNKEGELVAKSEVKQLNIKEKPLLAPPQFLAKTPKVLSASSRGKLGFEWKAVKSAKGYEVLLLDSKGSVLKGKKVRRGLASFDGLNPGDYQIQIKTIDQHGRKSRESTLRPALVPNKSDIKAPKIKNLKIE